MKKKTHQIPAINRCITLIKTFNPVTHSIDTHCSDQLGDVHAADVDPEDLLVQQIVYGCFKEKAFIKCFIENYYSDYASRVLRVDMTLYNEFAYLAIFRMEELGFQKFRELALTQEPSKIDTFIDYIYNKDNLWNSLRASWMTVRDLDYVEKQVIPKLERFIPEMQRFRGELANNAAADAAAKLVRIVFVTPCCNCDAVRQCTGIRLASESCQQFNYAF